MPELSKRRQRQLKAQGYDLAFLSRIQPQGNIDFKKDDRSWMSGDGYHTVLHFYECGEFRGLLRGGNREPCPRGDGGGAAALSGRLRPLDLRTLAAHICGRCRCPSRCI